MSTLLSKIVSILFHPIFVPLYGVFTLFSVDGYVTANSQYVENVWRIYLITFIITVFFPAMSFTIMLRYKIVSKLSMPLRTERFSPYISTLIYYCCFYWFLNRNGFQEEFLLPVFGSILVLVAVIAANFFIKISAHATAIAGLCGMLAALLKIKLVFSGIGLLAVFILLAGIVGSARLSLGAHQTRDIYLGYVLGFTIMFFSIQWQLGNW